MHDIINEEKQNLIPLNFDKESEGTKRFFGLGGPLNEIISNDRILLIDEIERSLHPDLINYYINTFLANSPASQLIITSHSLDFMSDPDEVRRDVIWFTEKNEAGATELYSLADFKSTDIRKGMDYLKAYKAGKFGAKPNIGSIFLKKD
jgi:AAA15 family ATPase/GTPase